MSAETLRVAASRIRTDSSVAYARGHMPMRVVIYNRAVADWLDSHAGDLSSADGNLSSCDSPGDTELALNVARAYLGEVAVPLRVIAPGGEW